MSERDRKIEWRYWASVILAIFLQIGTTIWWAAGVEERIARNSETIRSMQTHETRLTVLETQYSMNSQNLLRIETKIDRINEKLASKADRPK